MHFERDTPYLSVFSPDAGKYGPEITPYLDTFQAVDTSYFSFTRFRMMEIIFLSMFKSITVLKFLAELFGLPGCYSGHNDPIPISSIWWFSRKWFNNSWINTWTSTGDIFWQGGTYWQDQPIFCLVQQPCCCWVSRWPVSLLLL